MTRYTLQLEEDYDFILIGIACHAKNYRLCWVLNNAFNLKLEKEEQDLELVKGEETLRYPVYQFTNEDTHTSYTLISNRSKNNYFIPEQKQADFLLMIRNNFDEDIPEMIHKLRNIDMVLMAFEIDVERLKSRQNLLF